MMKKVIWVIVLVLAVVGLAGCGEEAQDLGLAAPTEAPVRPVPTKWVPATSQVTILTPVAVHTAGPDDMTDKMLTEIAATLAPTLVPGAVGPGEFATVTPYVMPVELLPEGAMRVVFDRGAVEAVVEGRAAQGEPARYVVQAGAGQIMRVYAATQFQTISIGVYGQGGFAYQMPDEGRSFWRGELQEDGDYILDLISPFEEVTFALSIVILPVGEESLEAVFEHGELGYTVRYQDWFVPVGSGGEAMMMRTTPAVTFQLADQTYYKQTNLGEATLVLGGAVDDGSCTVPFEYEESLGEAVFNEITFVNTRMTEGAAGNYYEQFTYRGVSGSACLEFVIFLHSSNIGNYSPGTVMEFDHGGVMEKMLDVLATLEME